MKVDIKTHLLKCILLLSTSQTDWKQSSDILSDISSDILSDISFEILSDILSDIFSDILSDISFDSLSDILSDISSDILFDISSDILSDISFDILSDISSDTLSDKLSTLFLIYVLIRSHIFSNISDISTDILSESAHVASFFFCWRLLGLIPGGAPFSQLNKGVKDAMVESTGLVVRQFMTKTCKKAINTNNNNLHKASEELPIFQQRKKYCEENNSEQSCG